MQCSQTLSVITSTDWEKNHWSDETSPAFWVWARFAGSIFILPNTARSWYSAGSPSSHMTLQLFHSEFPYIWENFIFFFISADIIRICILQKRLLSSVERQLLNDIKPLILRLWMVTCLYRDTPHFSLPVCALGTGFLCGSRLLWIWPKKIEPSHRIVFWTWIWMPNPNQVGSQTFCAGRIRNRPISKRSRFTPF